jgi:CheY-like chemotaxis protein
MSEALLDRLLAVLDEAESTDGNVFAPPVALLWPDKARQWERAIGQLWACRGVLTLGPHLPAIGSGPAFWLRCVVAGTVEVGRPLGLPVIYMPGVSRDDLRSSTADDQQLAPLVSLQHRSQWFTQSSGKDWTVRALLANKERGLGLNVAADESTAQALMAGLDHLIRQPLSRLQGRHVDAAFVNGLLSPDPVRLMLRWIDDPSTVQNEMEGAPWDAFVSQCKVDYGFDPAAAGAIEAARRLGAAEGAWQQVWQRFRESPAEYPDLPNRLREAQPAQLILSNPGAWPGPAADAEDALREVLTGLADVPASAARDTVLRLEEQHKARRGYVWAELGCTPLALALEHLAETARGTASMSPYGSVAQITEWYSTTGWKVDRSVLGALDEVDRQGDLAAVAGALAAIYQPWLDHAAKALQTAVGSEANSGNYVAGPAPTPVLGSVVVFVDGLRLDVGHLLAERLEGAGATVSTAVGLAALPTITQTAKPAVVPIDQTLLGAGDGLDACRVSSGSTAGVQVLRSLLAEAGVQVLASQEAGDPSGRAWTETGEVDHKGHDLGVRLAHEINDEVSRIARRVRDLLDAGWSTVTVVTDHGWLLLPSGLPKNEGLPVAATVSKKGRCARVKDGATVHVPTVPWHWDKDVRIAVAPGISCFEANQTYEHGGLSPQECIVPQLTVTTRATVAVSRAEITSIKWRGLTLVVEFADLPDGAKVDLRHHAGDEGSSIADLARVTGGTGKVILLVEDEELEGETAQLVVVAADGVVLLQRETTVGQNR